MIERVGPASFDSGREKETNNRREKNRESKRKRGQNRKKDEEQKMKKKGRKIEGDIGDAAVDNAE